MKQMKTFARSEFEQIKVAAEKLYRDHATTPTLDADLANAAGIHLRRVRAYLNTPEGYEEIVGRGWMGLEPEPKVFPEWALDSDGRRLPTVLTAYPKRREQDASDPFEEIQIDMLKEQVHQIRLGVMIRKARLELGPHPKKSDVRKAVDRVKDHLIDLQAVETANARAEKHQANSNTLQSTVREAKAKLELANERIRHAGLTTVELPDVKLITSDKSVH